MFTARYGQHLTFTNSTFCPQSAFLCFVWIWEQTAIISLYGINWLVCVTETGCVYCAVRTEHLTFTNSTFCPHSVFMCFVWIWEQTAIVSLYNINWLVCITETESVYCTVRSRYLYIMLSFETSAMHYPVPQLLAAQRDWIVNVERRKEVEVFYYNLKVSV